MITIEVRAKTQFVACEAKAALLKAGWVVSSPIYVSKLFRPDYYLLKAYKND